VRILIADDHPLARKGIRAMLESEPNLEVVGEAENGREALELCRLHRPEVVLMDVRMPEMDGLAATRAIKQEFPYAIVMILTSFEDPDYLSEAIEAGAAGYVLKDASQPQMIDALRGVLSGESPINPRLGAQLLLRLHGRIHEEERVDQSPTGRPPEDGPERALLESLSPRELEVLRLIAKGQTNQQIAQNLFISIYTVKKHVQRIITKLGVSDRTQAAVLSVRLGLHFIDGGA
jgi:DNA-binding NarL/FixJ family response regulator